MNKKISNQDDWDDLLHLITDKTLTPVLGKEMYIFKDSDSTDKPLDVYLVQQMLKKNNIPENEFSTESLSDAFNYLKNEKKIDVIDIIDDLKNLVRDITLDKPQPFKFKVLEEFLKISDLTYFINTTVYNNILEKIFVARKEHPATSCNFSLETSVDDFPVLEKSDTPYIFNLFGSLLKTTDVALSDEDMLECASSFNNKMSGATNIVNALKNNSLLFIGCRFPNWMERFALRLLANQKMQDWGQRRKIYVINDPGDKRKEEYDFLKNYRVITYEGSTAEFVHELSSQWEKKNPKNKSIFLSYTRADVQAVENIKKAIEQIGNITCWFDKHELEPGDDWRAKIVVNIRKADLFIPLISANSLEHQDGYVQKEWYQGTNEWVYRNEDKQEGKYLIPVVIDDSPLYSDKISKIFDPTINITKIPQGNPDESFLTEIKEILNLS